MKPPRTTTATRKRTQAKTLRNRFLYTDVTQEEYKKILRHCHDKHISVSQFFADLLLKEASKPKGDRQQKLTLQIQLTPAEHEKLQLLSRLHEKESVTDFVRHVLDSKLKVQRLHVPAKTKLVRYYLSNEEHETVTKHMSDAGMSARNYPAMLALRAIGKAPKKRNK